MKNSYSKFLVILLSFMMALSACAPSSNRGLNDGRNETAGVINAEDVLPPVVEQDLVTTNDNFQTVLQEKGAKAEDYQVPEQNIKNGNDTMYVGYTKLKNIKSIFNRVTKELEVSGVAEILNADKKTIRVTEAFRIKGKYKAKSGTINLSPVDDSNENGVQVRAVVTCLKTDLDGKYDCARAIIDLILKHKNNFYTEQLESNAFEKPKIVDDKDKKSSQPTTTTEITEPEIQNQVKNTADQVDETDSTVKGVDIKIVEKPTAIVSATPVTQNKAVIDDSKEEADGALVAEVEEGDDGSIEGRFEGKAAVVELAKLFKKSTKPVAKEKKADANADNNEDENDEDDDEVSKAPIRQDTKGRAFLTDQAVGSPDQGRLRNASFLKTHLTSYKLTDRIVIANSSTKNYYGTQEMMNVLEALGNKAFSFQQNKIHISRISAERGGRLPPSKSHQNGMDSDIGYPTIQGKVGFPIVASGGSLKKSDFSPVKTLELFKFLMTQKVSPVDRLFVDQSIINSLCREAKNSGKFRGSERAAYVKLFENLQHVDGHGNHYHLRLRCTPNQPDCRHKIYRKMNNCAG